MTAAAHRCVLAFDVGTKRIGVAVGNSLSCAARPLAVLELKGGAVDWPELLRMIDTWRPDVLVIGDPLTLAGDVQEITRSARKLARDLAQRSGRPTVMVDERSSSKEADRQFAAARAAGTAKRKHGAQQDALAAAVILDRWFDAGMPGAGSPETGAQTNLETA